MYSHEIEEYLKARNYLISAKEYLRILETSPQINHTLLNCYDDSITMWTEDRYKFVIKLKKEH